MHLLEKELLEAEKRRNRVLVDGLPASLSPGLEVRHKETGLIWTIKSLGECKWISGNHHKRKWQYTLIRNNWTMILEERPTSSLARAELARLFETKEYSMEPLSWLGEGI